MRWWEIKKRNADLDRELRSDVELEEEEQRENGLPPEEARYAARRAFGNATLIKEQTRETWGWMWIDRLLRDLRYALRQLAKAPGFTLTAVLTLAIGIGGVTAVFSIVLAVLLRPLPFEDSGRLISLHEHIEGDLHELNVTAPDVLTFERESNAFAAVGGFIGSGYELTGAGAPFKARAERVTASLFPLLGIEPMLGRTSNYLTLGDYFEAIRIPLIRGRYLGVSDDQPGAPLVVVISQSLACRYFPGKDPLGLQIKVGPNFASPMPAMTVVGVVGDNKQGARDEATVPQMYEPLAQAAADLGPFAPMMGVVGDMDLVIRTTGDPASQVNAVSSTVHQLDPLLPVSNVNTMDEIVAATESSRRFNTIILTSFAGIALLLSLLGIYGVMAYSVSERTSEIAIRMALGETRHSVLLKTLRHAFSLTVLGGTIGLAASLGLTRLLSDLLYNVKPLDVSVMISALILLFVCSSLAALMPARRAVYVEPMQALRSE